MKNYVLLLGFVLTFMGGFAYGSLSNYVDNIDQCATYTIGKTTWVGYRAISDDHERRCFWLENRFPYRIKQGVERL